MGLGAHEAFCWAGAPGGTAVLQPGTANLHQKSLTFCNFGVFFVCSVVDMSPMDNVKLLGFPWKVFGERWNSQL